MSLWTHQEAEAATLGQANRPFAVEGLSIDTRTLREGDLFVALKGEHRDGHDFLRAAFAAKAGAALVTHAPDGVAGPLLTVGHTQRGLEDLARAARVFGNFAEYAALVIVLMALAEILGASRTMLHVYGAAFVLGRIAHAVGLSSALGPSIGRQLVMVATLGVLIALAVSLLAAALPKL